MSNNIPDSVYLDDLHPARFLKVTDLTERWKVDHIIVAFSRLASEETTPKVADVDPATHKPRIVMQPVLYFLSKDGTEYSKGYLLSAGVDVQSLKKATGSKVAGELVGKKFCIMIGEHKGKKVLRISPEPVKEGNAQ